jgi:hypothetical protein
LGGGWGTLAYEIGAISHDYCKQADFVEHSHRPRGWPTFLFC